MNKRPSLVALAALPLLLLGAALPGHCQASGGISMTIYPVERGGDGLQYLITPSGKRVTIPGLGIAPNATQVSVYRDQNNNFWYTDSNGQPVKVTPQQLEFASAQINAQSGGGSPMTQPMAGGAQQFPPQGPNAGPAAFGSPAAGNYYSSTPSYAGGYNGIPYGTPINMEAPGQYSYMAPSGSKQYVSPTPQTSASFNQWQQQAPYGGQGQAASQQASNSQNGGRSGNGGGVFSGMRDRRIDRLDDRSRNQSNNANNDQSAANSNMDSGRALGAGFRSRQSAREQRRSDRADRRSDRLQDRQDMFNGSGN